MIVYAVMSWWDTDESSYAELVGVYRSREGARAALKADVAKLKSEMNADGGSSWWSEDSDEGEDLVTLITSDYDDTYAWWIDDRELED